MYLNPPAESFVTNIGKRYKRIERAKPLGRPLLLSDIDEAVQKYVKQTRLCGGVINTTVMVAAAKGFMLEKNKSGLAEYGCQIKINFS